MALLNVGTTIVAWLALTFTVCLHLRGSQVDQFNPLVLSLIFFNGLNILIALCEIALGRHIDLIKSDYEGLRKKYRGTEWDACVAFLTMPLTPAQVFDMRSWSKMWSTYALYDPSYQNSEAFGFFIDVGNGWSTIPTSLLALVALVRPDGTALEGYASPLVVGCVGIASYWQIMYGTFIYFLSFIWNRRYQGFRPAEIWTFVVVSNGTWIIFPFVGIYSCVQMLAEGTMTGVYG